MSAPHPRVIMGLYSLFGPSFRWPSLRDPALIDSHASYTYGQLFEAVDARSKELLAGIAETPLVQIDQERTADTLITILAALGSGLPFEVGTVLDKKGWSLSQTPWLPPHMASQASVPSAYVMATSGSLGVKKKTLVTRRGLGTVFSDLLGAWAEVIPTRAVWTQSHELTFGYSMCEILGCLSFGGELQVIDREESTLNRQLRRITRSSARTVSCLTPSELNLYMHEDGATLPDVIILSGEPAHRLTSRSVERLKQSPRCTVINTYAATETSGQITSHVISPGEWPEVRLGYVGKALPNVNVRIVTDAGCDVVPEDAESEGVIVVSGPQVAAGYLHDAGEHSKAFAETSPRSYTTGDRGRWAIDGALIVSGRASRTVKLAGQWIDLDLVERTLASTGQISEVATFLDEEVDVRGANEARLGVALATPSPEISVPLARRVLLQLAGRPVPTRIYVCTSLPKQGNGKLDMSNIKSGHLVHYHKDIETQVLEIWRSLLGQGISPTTDVFAEGIDSVGVVTFTETLRLLTDIPLPASLVFDNPTVRDQVAALEDFGTDKSFRNRSTPTRKHDDPRSAARRAARARGKED